MMTATRLNKVLGAPFATWNTQAERLAVIAASSRPTVTRRAGDNFRASPAHAGSRSGHDGHLAFQSFDMFCGLLNNQRRNVASNSAEMHRIFDAPRGVRLSQRRMPLPSNAAQPSSFGGWRSASVFLWFDGATSGPHCDAAHSYPVPSRAPICAGHSRGH